MLFIFWWSSFGGQFFLQNCFTNNWGPNVTLKTNHRKLTILQWTQRLYVLVSSSRVQQHEESLFKEKKFTWPSQKSTKRQKQWNWQIFVINMEKGDNQENVAKMAYNVNIHKGLVNLRREEGPLRRWKIWRRW